MENKIRANNKSNRQKMIVNMLSINPSVSGIILSMNGLNVPDKTEIVRVGQKLRPNYMLFTRNPL